MAHDLKDVFITEAAKTLELLSNARSQLQDQLSSIEIDDTKRDSAINSISLIVRTLEKIDQLSRALLQDERGKQDQLTDEDYEALQDKVKNLIKEAASKEQQL